MEMEEPQLSHDLKAILPPDFEYKLIKFEQHEAFFKEPRFIAEFHVNIFTKEDSKRWLTEFQDNTLSTWRVAKTFPEDSSRVVYKIRYRCHHNTVPASHGVKTPHAKNTDCDAMLQITVGKPLKLSRSKKNEISKTHPCLIRLNCTHNHLLYSAMALSFRDPSPQIRDKFIALFASHQPASALEVHRSDIQMEHDDNYFEVAADRRICPDRMWVYHLYYSTFENSYGKGHGLEMMKKLESVVNEYNESCKQECAKMVYKEDEYFVVAFCSPLMRRVHEHLPAAAELVCIDSSGNMDRFQCRVFLLMVPSSVGGLPLGVLITSSESEQVISVALNTLKEILPEKAFYGRCFNGPEVFITDDSASERKSLKLTFPLAILILCIFHILQAAWRYIWDAKTGVDKNDKAALFACVKSLVYCKTEEHLQAQYEENVDSDVVKKYDRFAKYFRDLYGRRREWAICYRSELPIRGNNTNNIDEAAMRILKDKILLRTKAYNVVQLFGFLSTELDQYYSRKVLRIISGRPDQRLKTGFVALGKKAQSLKVRPTSDSTTVFNVYNKDTKMTYLVDVNAWTCSCLVGLNGGACKHQFAVCKTHNLDSMQFLPSTHKEKLLFHFIATGSKHVKTNFYEKLQPDLPSSDTSPEICDVPSASSLSEIEEKVELPNVLSEIDHNIRIDRSEALIREICDDLIRRVKNQPDQFCDVVTKFSNTYKGFHTDSALTSALVTFGNYSGGGSVAKKKKYGRQITVQATAAARRASKVGGRRCVTSGRTPRYAYGSDHHYPKGTVNSMLLPKSRKLPAPHAIQFCVDAGMSLGKTHSAKIRI